jgi:hypothetical protein
MGAYTGFEKISWTYKQRPRKAFSKRKRIRGRKIISTYKRPFILQPSKNEREIYIGFGLLLVFLIAAGLYYKVPEFNDYNKQLSIQTQNRIERHDKIAFKLLMNSAVYRLKDNNLIGAHSELTLAKAIYPNDEMVNQLLIETLVGLCDGGNTYCNELDATLMNSL